MAVFNKDIDVENIYKNLGKADAKQPSLFESMKDVYTLAFILGVINDKRQPIKRKSSDGIKDVYFKDDRDIMDLMTLHLTKDIKSLNRKDEMLRDQHNLIEEYANGGIRIIDEGINGDHFNLDALITFVKGFEKDKIKPKKVDLADLFFEANNYED